MKMHLLNWTLGPAILSGILATAGAGPDAHANEVTWRSLPGTAVGVAAFFGCWFVVMFVLRLIVQRLNEGRLAWADIRTMAAVIAIQWVLLACAFGVLLAVRQTALTITGGWPAGVHALPVGAAIGAGAGLILGLGVAQLRLPERLGLVKEEESKSSSAN